MKLLDPNDPFFRHPATRWATVLVPLAMALAELVFGGGPGWVVVFGAAAAYAFWILIIKGPDQG
jgi:hypothetical protein